MKRFLIAAAVSAATVAAMTAAGPYDAVVDCKGSGDYLTVSEAIEAAPEGRTEPWLILVKRGDYNELVKVPESKPFIHLIGEGMDNTVIHYPLNYGGDPVNKPRYAKTLYWPHSINNRESAMYKCQSAVADIRGHHFLTSGIGYVNDWGTKASSGPQALAMYSNADCVAMGDCSMRSFQDTWRTADYDSCRNYVNNCLIEGAVDYIYGGGDVFVDRSTLYNVRSGSVIVAPNHTSPEYGYVFRDCVIDGTAEAADTTVKFGRPWQGAPRTVFINTYARIPMLPAGWDNMGTVPALFADYNTINPDGSHPDMSLRKTHYIGRSKHGGPIPEGDCRAEITPEEAARYTYANVISSRDGWDPCAMLTHIEAPRGLTLSDEGLTWEPVEGAIGYVVYDGDEIVALTTEPHAMVPEHMKCSYKVHAVNAAGVIGKRAI